MYFLAYVVPLHRAVSPSCGMLTTTLSVIRLTSKFNLRLAMSLTIVPLVLNFLDLFTFTITECFDKNGTFLWNVVNERFGPTAQRIRITMILVSFVISAYASLFTIIVFHALLLWKLRQASKIRQKLSQAAQEDHNTRLTALLMCVMLGFVFF